jgi:NAD-dependent SIR2 family protein deacetylase
MSTIINDQPVKYSALFSDYLTLEGSKLAQFNMIMTKLRRSARQAPLGNFHKFLHLAFDSGRVVYCLTRNFDGLETRDRQDLIDDVVMVHGDNRILRCAFPDCPGIFGEHVALLDQKLLDGELVECTACLAVGEWAIPFSCSTHLVRHYERVIDSVVLITEMTHPQRRNRSKGASKYLRPAVLADEGLTFDMEAGEQLNDLVSAAEDCDALLVVGTSLKNEPFCKLVREVASKVHSIGGAVVYIDRESLNERRWGHHIDFHLRGDIELFAGAILESMHEVSLLSGCNLVDPVTYA